MHVPDGFLDPAVAGAFWLLSAVAIALAARRARGILGGARTPLLGVVAAGIFAAQMLNWPIPGGTSAHFVGGAFAGILLGPSLGILAVSAVVIVQALVFGDGGVVTLGLNLWAMGVVDVVAGYALFRAVAGYDETVAAFVAGWGAITLSALFVGLGAGLSAAFAYELSVTIPVMAGGHAVLGLVEGAITALVYRHVAASRPDLVLGRSRLVGGEVTRA
jgi:cobalt/nickel transport system permease protein